MPLYVQNGKLLEKDGALGTSAGCCCGGGGGLGGCLCGTSPPVTRNFPSSVTVTLTLGSQVLPYYFLNSIYHPGGCCESTTAMQSSVNGTYVLYPDGRGIIDNCITYTLAGYMDVVWCCNSGNVQLSASHCLMFYGEATTTSCFGVTTTCVGQWVINTSVLSGTCSQTSYTYTDFDRIVQYAFQTTGRSCPQNNTEIRRPFYVDIALTGNF
jgi:hypothetical protein